MPFRSVSDASDTRSPRYLRHLHACTYILKHVGRQTYFLFLSVSPYSLPLSVSLFSLSLSVCLCLSLPPSPSVSLSHTHTHIHTRRQTRARARTHTHTHTHAHTDTNTHTRTRTHARTHARTHTEKGARARAHTHTHTHTHTLFRDLSHDVIGTAVGLQNLDQFLVRFQRELLSRQIDEVPPLDAHAPQRRHANELGFKDAELAPHHVYVTWSLEHIRETRDDGSNLVTET